MEPFIGRYGYLTKEPFIVTLEEILVFITIAFATKCD
jgi:hypothetical protein